MGDYASHAEVPQQNSLAAGAAIPTQVHSTKDRAFVFRGSEEICDIYSSNLPEGKQVVYDINPGLENFMEWLSGIAPSFSEWYPNGIVIEYVPAVSPQSADANGKVAMCFSYDNGDPDPGSFKDISQYSMSIQFPPWKPGLMAGECKPSLTALNWFKVRTGDVAITDEAHSMYDWAKLVIRTGGQVNNGVLLGTIKIIYDFVFQKPLAPRPVGRTLTDVWNTTTMSAAAYLGTARTARVGNTLGLTFSGNNTIVLPSWVNHGKFLLNLECQGTGATIAAPTISLVGANALNWLPGGGSAFLVPFAGIAGSVTWSCDMVFEVTSASATITFAGGTIPTAAVGVLIITAIDTDVTVLNRRHNHYEQYWKDKEDEKLQELKYVDDAVETRMSQLLERLQNLENKDGLRPPPAADVRTERDLKYMYPPLADSERVMLPVPTLPALRGITSEEFARRAKELDDREAQQRERVARLNAAVEQGTVRLTSVSELLPSAPSPYEARMANINEPISDLLSEPSYQSVPNDRPRLRDPSPARTQSSGATSR